MRQNAKRADILLVFTPYNCIHVRGMIQLRLLMDWLHGKIWFFNFINAFFTIGASHQLYSRFNRIFVYQIKADFGVCMYGMYQESQCIAQSEASVGCRNCARSFNK